MAIATAAAAEAAVAAANAAAEVVRLTGASRSHSYLSKGDQILAAIKIQSAYRAHLVSSSGLGSSYVASNFNSATCRDLHKTCKL